VNDLTDKQIAYRKTVAVIERAIKSMPASLGEDPFHLTHDFADGLYVRKIFIPAGFFIVGKYHQDSFVSFIECGDMSILTEDGVRRVTGAQSQISPAGTKRFGFSHADTVWVTVHANPTNERDIEKLEKMIHSEDDFALPINLFSDSIYDERFDSKKFVTLTEKVFAAEKIGFWSDWTEEQQKAFDSSDWELFSRLRGYSENEINDLRDWIHMKEFGENIGFNPLAIVRDIVYGYALRNVMMDTKGEIMRSSCIPSSKKGGI